VVTGRYLCSVSVEPLTANVTLGGSQEFFCRIVRNIDPTYQWLQNGSFITSMIPLSPQEPTGDLLIFAAMFQDAGEYACRATTIIGSLQSESATVNVQGTWQMSLDYMQVCLLYPLLTKIQPSRWLPISYHWYTSCCLLVGWHSSKWAGTLAHVLQLLSRQNCNWEKARANIIMTYAGGGNTFKQTFQW